MEKKLKVLIADNSNQFATQCQKELETQGYEVSTMENDGAKVFDAIALLRDILKVYVRQPRIPVLHLQ